MLGVDHYADRAITYNYLALLLALETGVDTEYALGVGGLKVDETSQMTKYSNATVQAMRALRKQGYSLPSIGAMYGLTMGSVWKLLKRRIHDGNSSLLPEVRGEQAAD